MSASISLRKSKTLVKRLQNKLANRGEKLAELKDLQRKLEESGDELFREHLIDLKKFIQQQVRKHQSHECDIIYEYGKKYDAYKSPKILCSELLGHSNRNQDWLYGRINEDDRLNEYVSLLGSTGLSPSQENKLLGILEKKIKEIKPNPLRKIKNLETRIIELESELESALENLNKLEKEEEQRQLVLSHQQETTAAIRARLDSHEKKSRARAGRIRKRLPTTLECPYCGEPIIKNPVADHIYPIAKSGQSIESNMVMICFECNSKKSSMTLYEFCIKNELNFEEIAKRLKDLGKTV